MTRRSAIRRHCPNGADTWLESYLDLDTFDVAISGGSVAKGVAVAPPGARTRRHVVAFVCDIVFVKESLIEAAIALLLQIENRWAEVAGAAGLPTILADQQGQSGVLSTEIGVRGGRINTVIHDCTFVVTDAKPA